MHVRKEASQLTASEEQVDVSLDLAPSGAVKHVTVVPLAGVLPLQNMTTAALAEVWKTSSKDMRHL